MIHLPHVRPDGPEVAAALKGKVKNGVLDQLEVVEAEPVRSPSRSHEGSCQLLHLLRNCCTCCGMTGFALPVVVLALLERCWRDYLELGSGARAHTGNTRTGTGTIATMATRIQIPIPPNCNAYPIPNSQFQEIATRIMQGQEKKRAEDQEREKLRWQVGSAAPSWTCLDVSELAVCGRSCAPRLVGWGLAGSQPHEAVMLPSSL